MSAEVSDLEDRCSCLFIESLTVSGFRSTKEVL